MVATADRSPRKVTNCPERQSLEAIEQRIADGVAEANVPTLLMVLVQLTGDLGWLQPPYRVRRAQGIDENDTGGLAPEAIDAVRRAAINAVAHWFRTGEVAIADPSEELLVQMMAGAMGENVASEYGPMIAYDLDLVSRSAASVEAKRIAAPDGFHVAVIGGGARAYLGTAIPGFPNFFCLYGPNSQSGAGGSIMALLEAQVNYALSAIEQMLGQNLGAIEVRQETHDAYNARLEDDLKDTVWTHPGVSTYFRNSRGRVTINSGIRKVDFWRMTRHAEFNDYVLESAR